MNTLQLVLLAGMLLVSSAQAQDSFVVSSPDGTIAVTIRAGATLTYGVTRAGRPIILDSPISLMVADGPIVGPDAVVTDARRRTVDAVLTPVVPEKTSVVYDRFNELALVFEDGWGLDVRAYDDGVAYRFRTSHVGEVVVAAEEFTARFDDDSKLWFPAEESFLTHSERQYEDLRLGDVPSTAMASLPVLVAIPDGPKVAVTESDLRDFPGLYVTGSSGDALRGILPMYPLAEEQVGDRTVKVTERAEYLARTTGPRSLPWRVFVIAERDGDLIESTMVWRLASPLAIDDPSWIRPGKVAWDWWNANNLYGVDFEAGLNTETYRYYIDFASEHGIEYVILDEGWSAPDDLWALNPDIDLDALRGYAAERGVGIILWVVWSALDQRFDEALDLFAAWGIAGIKVDFMQRDDQKMVQYYWKVAEGAARRHLLVDFHGSYKPAGLRRAYPNVLTREGVRGLEHSKWSAWPTPEHNVTLPFIRMLAGPMDYTPGAMRNAQEAQFTPVFDRPMSLGTRAHQLAMYVVFESPLQMLADSPSNYVREEECLAFLSGIPTVWDETRVLAATVGDMVVVARRRGDVWYVGAMTDWTARDLAVDLDFLGDGLWSMEAFADGLNAARNAEDYRRSETSVVAGDTLAVRLATGGGWVARFTRK